MSKKVEFFHLRQCPHCKKTIKLLEELKREELRFRELPIRMIEEAEEAEYADSKDYYYVPTIFIGDEKVHEGKLEDKEVLRHLLEQAL